MTTQDRSDPLSPAALAQVPEVRNALVDLTFAVGSYHLGAPAVFAAETALLLSIRDAVLSAERQRLLGMTPEETMRKAVEAVNDKFPVSTEDLVTGDLLAVAAPILRQDLAAKVAVLEGQLAERNALVNENFRLLQEAESHGKRLHHRLMGLRADIEAQLKDLDRLSGDERQVAETAQFTLEAVATNIRSFIADESDWPCLAESEVATLREKLKAATLRAEERHRRVVAQVAEILRLDEKLAACERERDEEVQIRKDRESESEARYRIIGEWSARCVASEAREAALRDKMALTIGVGDGGGSLFVHGDHDSIAVVRRLIDRSVRLAQVESVIDRATQGEFGQEAASLARALLAQKESSNGD